MFTTLAQVQLSDGALVALQRIDTTAYGGTVEYAVQLGLTGQHVQHATRGYLVPCTSEGCVWCAEYSELARQCFELVAGCTTLREASRKGGAWWQGHIHPLLYGLEA